MESDRRGTGAFLTKQKVHPDKMSDTVEPMDCDSVDRSMEHHSDTYVQSTHSGVGHTSANDFLSDASHRSMDSKQLEAETRRHNHHSSYSKETNVDFSWEGPAGPAGSTRDRPLKRDQPSPDLYQAEESEGIQPSAPPDEATFYVKMMGDPFLGKTVLQKNLQSWLNKEFDKKVTINSLSVDGNWATVYITPSSALEDLLKDKDIEIPLKNTSQTATVQFHSTAPSSRQLNKPSTSRIQMTVSATVDLTGCSPTVQLALKTKFSHRFIQKHSLTITGSFEEVEQFHNEVTKVIREAEAGPADLKQKEIICPVPLIHFSYVNQAYRKEIEQIEKINGVKINAEVKVSIQEDSERTGRDCQLTKANKELIDIIQTCASDFDNVRIPLTDVDQGDFMNTLKNIENEKTKLMLNVCGNGCEVFGQKQHLVAVRKALGIQSTGHAPFDMTSVMDHGFTENASGASAGPETPQMIRMDIKDPLLSNGLTMDNTYWDLIMSVFGEKITAIKRKFGVDFIREMSAGKVKVKTRPTHGSVSAESQAISALMRLYQKVATSVMSCRLLDSTQAKNVLNILEEIGPQHGCVLVAEHYGPSKMVGLPEHLNLAVREIEKTLGGPVFRTEDKQRIGSSRDDRLTSTRAQPESTVTRSTVAGATGGVEEENCPICMDTFKDKSTLSCKHEFCGECLRQAVESMGSICPVCKDVFGKVEGNQPEGHMTYHTSNICLPGFSNSGTITINYVIPDGKQTNKHPHPGNLFYGTRRTAYLPNNKEGNEVLHLLRKAFDQKLIFTVGMSRTTGAENSVTWNDIHHKTNTHGGPQGFGYPDPDYLRRVKDELKAKGVK
ncbi:hypothetical protein DPEC_G00213380 [Dallia pectoralis]|uniref:Uncharacterized protein n=1 Tax=Dallia pectoralis TaxID=75939 RepID=A0ACC2G6K0_DALPE|nr:hypothetical protein DPEC_G00213380 [Dallia pectoralis]